MGAALLLMSLNTSTKCLLSALPVPLQVRKVMPQVSRSTGWQRNEHQPSETTPPLRRRRAVCRPPTPAEISVTSDRAGAAMGSGSTLKPGGKHPSGRFLVPLGIEGGRKKKKIMGKG